MQNYDGGVVADQATGRPLMGRNVKVFDEETDAPVQVYREGQPVRLVTGAHGLIPQFQTEDSTRRVRLEVGPVRLRQWSQEMIASAAAAGDDISSALEQVEVVRAEAAAIVPRMEQIEAMAGLAPGEVTDAQTANLLSQPGSLTRAASVQATAPMIDTRLEPVMSRAGLPGIVSLLAGTDDEVPSSLNPLNSRTADTVNVKVGSQAWKSATTFAGTLQQQYTETRPVPPFQAACLWVYVEDASKVSDIGVRLYFDSTYTTTNRWFWAFQASSPKQTIVTGWNLLRIPANWAGATITDRSTIYRWETYAVVNAGTSVTFGHLYLETPARAKVIVVADRGYQRYYTGLYQDLKARGVPTTFAVDCTLFGSGTPGAADEAMTETLMHEVSQENGNSISFHGWDGRPTAQMTPTELRIDTAKALKWLQARGYTGRMWRAAYVQGSALPASHAAVKDMLVGSVGPGSPSRLTPWPPRDMHDIPRYAMDNNRSTAEITAWFDQLKATHMTAVIFVHSEGSGQFDYDATRRAHFLAQIDRGLAEGWLEAHTFETLYHRSGGTFQSLAGAHLAEYTAPDGTRVARHVM